MYRFLLRPRWIAFTVVVVTAIVVMINLGFWQLRRLDERQAFNEAVTQRFDQPAVGVDELVPAEAEVGDDELAAIEWRPVEAAGHYLPDEELRVVNRSQGGRAGDNVVTPLLLDDGRVLLVARGFVPLDVEPPPPPTGDVTIEGRLRRSEARRTGALSDQGEGDLTVAQRVDIPRLAAQLPGEVVPMYVELTDSDPPQSGESLEPIAEPTLDEGPHLSYAVQWFIFSALAALGWFLAVRRSSKGRPKDSLGVSAAG
jgi:cytochrome oxidase assembly protein ShyY1